MNIMSLERSVVQGTGRLNVLKVRILCHCRSQIGVRWCQLLSVTRFLLQLGTFQPEV
jgi:hypothetical protein